MNGKTILLGLAPWALFSVLAQQLGSGAVGVAALLACAGSLALAVVGASSKGGVKIIDAAGVVTFGVIAALGFFGPPALDQTLVDFARGGSALVLAAVMGISVVTVPFTEQYARESVDPRYWSGPEFRATNKRISAVWAGVVFVMAICHLIAGAIAAAAGVDGGHPGSVLLNWMIPIGLIMWAVKQTKATADDRPDAPSEHPVR